MAYGDYLENPLTDAFESIDISMKRLITQSLLLGLALFSIQGTIYLFQLIAASILRPEQYSAVRVIESVGALGSLLVTFGIPSIALVRIGVLDNRKARRNFVFASLLLLACCFMFFCGGFFAAARYGYLGSGVADTSAFVALLALAMSFRLFLSSVLQADQKLVQLAASAIASCALSYVVAASLYFTGVDPIISWLSARLTLELVNCALLIGSELKSSPRGNEVASVDNAGVLASAGTLARTASPIGVSLAMRSVIENGPILFLSATGAVATVIAQVGLAVTLVGIALFPATIVQSILIPRIASHLKKGEQFGYAAVAMLSGAVVSLVALLVIAALTAQQQNWIGFLSWSTIVIIAFILVAKLIAGACGGMLLLLNRGSAIMLLNGVTLGWGVAIALMVRGTAKLEQSQGLLLAILAIEGTAMCTYLSVTIFFVRRLWQPAERPF